ncbi:MAG: LytR C-terminal domain-containing protein [Nocardioidaceae bacterium]|nr:LytR C-terminal domain-containing protein [Nocardioidaceae bacterium]
MPLSSPIAVGCAAAVVVAGVAFVATGTQPAPVDVVAPVTASPSAAPTSKAPRPVIRARKPDKKGSEKKEPPRPVIRRSQTYVEVYNNSGISGLAGTTAARAQGAGWQVVGSDNWYGTIPASTVYFPPRLRTEAALLGKDIGITRLQPAIAPMRFDRLTVILTTDYIG